MTSTDDLRDRIRAAVLGAECEQTPACPDCITDSVLTAVAAANPPAPAEPYEPHDDGSCSECGTTKRDIWPIPGRPGYFCRACCLKLTGTDPAQPA